MEKSLTIFERTNVAQVLTIAIYPQKKKKKNVIVYLEIIFKSLSIAARFLKLCRHNLFSSKDDNEKQIKQSKSAIAQKGCDVHKYND